MYQKFLKIQINAIKFVVITLIVISQILAMSSAEC